MRIATERKKRLIISDAVPLLRMMVRGISLRRRNGGKLHTLSHSVQPTFRQYFPGGEMWPTEDALKI